MLLPEQMPGNAARVSRPSSGDEAAVRVLKTQGYTVPKGE